jgi:hypothetical protein
MVDIVDGMCTFADLPGHFAHFSRRMLEKSWQEFKTPGSLGFHWAAKMITDTTSGKQ